MASDITDVSIEALPEGPVTLMFTDIASSTEMTSKVGDERWRDLVTRHHETVEEVASQHGGRIIKSLGDGLMLAFTSSRRAVQAAIEIQDSVTRANARGEPFRIKVGLNTGEVAHDQGDMLGTAVNAAARISDRAEAGQILASDIVRQLVGTMPGIEFQDRGRVTLKGFPERWRLFEVTSAHRKDHSGKTGFVGREEERSALIERIDSVFAGRGGVVMIGGEPGIGKTRLAQETANDARRRGALALTGRCQDTDSPLPYAPWVEMTETIARIAPKEVFRTALGEDASEIARLVPEIRRMFPDVPEPIRLPPEQERHFMLTSIVNYLERSSGLQPLVLILDDLQWADEASLLLLNQVAERAQDLPILIIGTYRDIELEVSRPLARTLEDLLRRRLAQRLSLRRFSEEGVEQLLTALALRLHGSESAGSAPPALVKVIYRETEGNPFFVEEVFQHLHEEGRLFDRDGDWRSDVAVDDFDVPESVRLVIGRRLEKLTESTRGVLTTAAVIGPSFSYEVLEEVGSTREDEVVDAIDEAEAAHLISSARRGSETKITFAHELIRQTLLSSLSVPRRQRVHAQIADAFERVYSNRGVLVDHAIHIAHHLYQAAGSADPEKTLRYLSMAGDLALNAAAFDEARQHYQLAIELQHGDEATLAGLEFKLGYSQRGSGAWEEALANWHSSLSRYEKLQDPTGGRVARAVAYQLAWAGRTSESLAVSRRGLAIVAENSPRERARLLAAAGLAMGLLGDSEAYTVVAESEAYAKDVGDERTLLEAMSARAVIEWAFVRPAECLEVARAAAEGFKERGDLFQWVGASAFVEQSLTMIGRLEEAHAVGEEFAPVAEKIGHLGSLVTHRRSASFRTARSGQSFVESAETDEIEVERSGLVFIGQARTWKAIGLFFTGDWERATELALGPALQEAEGVYQNMNPAGLVMPLTLMGHMDKAMVWLEDVEPPKDVGAPIPSGRKMLMAAAPEVLALADERQRAASFHAFIDHILNKEGLVFGFYGPRPTQFIAAVTAGATADWAAADRYLNDALTVCKELRYEMQLPILHTVWSAVLVNWAEGRREEGIASLERAVSLYEQMSMPRHAASARKKLAEIAK